MERARSQTFTQTWLYMKAQLDSQKKKHSLQKQKI